MKTIQITEMDQTIVPACDLATFVPANDFIKNLVELAKVNGKATADDADGCPVTVIITEQL